MTTIDDRDPEGAPEAPIEADVQDAVAEPVPTEPEIAPLRKERPFLGPTLWCSGVLSWAFAVAGEYTTERWPGSDVPLSEGSAVLFVLGAFGAAVWLSAHASIRKKPGPFVQRAAGIAVRGAGLTFATVVGLIVLAGATRGADGPVTIALIFNGGILAAIGRHLSLSHESSSPRSRFFLVMTWIAAAFLSIGALGQL